MCLVVYASVSIMLDGTTCILSDNCSEIIWCRRCVCVCVCVCVRVCVYENLLFGKDTMQLTIFPRKWYHKHHLD